MRYNLGNGLGTFELAVPFKTITGYLHPIDHPLVLSRFITNITEPTNTELDISGRSRLVFRVRPLRFKQHLSSSSWVHEASDGGLFRGFDSAIYEHDPQALRSFSSTTAFPPQNGSWYSCSYCLNESSSDSGRPMPGPIFVHRSEWKGIVDGRITDLSLAFAQSDPYLNGTKFQCTWCFVPFLCDVMILTVHVNY